MSPPSPNICPECGKPVPVDSQHQICPACLIAQALASRTLGVNPAAAVPPLMPEEIASKFPQFEILECLGRGGMGVVYKARQKSLNRLVAIKVLAPERVHEARFAERFAREAELLARLGHPHIVTIHDFGETGGLFYLVMEFVDGVNLRDLLREGKLAPKQALAIVPPICEALQYAHDKGIVHCDIKPENLLLDRDGRLKIADFGIATLVGATGGAAGTPPYMAPEQAGNSAEVDHRADIYALGVVLYEMLTGERPRTDLVAPSKKVQLDVRIDEMVLRALEKSPELRYQTANEFRTVVETMVASGERAPAAQLPVAAVAPPAVTSNVAPPKNDPVMDTAVAEARKRVAAPAIGLIIVSGLNLLLTGVLGPALFSHLFFSLNHILIPPQETEFLPDWSLRITLLTILFSGCLSALTFVGAWRMRRLKGYGLAVTAAILAIITPPGLLVGLAFGIWALVVLCRRDVQAAFRRTNSTTTGMGCLLACLVLLGSLLVMTLTIIGLRALAPRPRSTANPTPVAPVAPVTPATPVTSTTPPPLTRPTPPPTAATLATLSAVATQGTPTAVAGSGLKPLPANVNIAIKTSRYATNSIVRPYEESWVVLDGDGLEGIGPRPFISLDPASRMDGKPIAKSALSELNVNYFSDGPGNAYRTGETYGVVIGANFPPGQMLPRKPGTYKFDFVIVTNNGRWACPTTEVEIKEPTSEAEERLISEFEQTGASAFLNHETGIRMAGDPDSQPVSYVALDAFVAVHPDSYIVRVIRQRAANVWLRDINTAGCFLQRDRDWLALVCHSDESLLSLVKKDQADRLARQASEPNDPSLEKQLDVDKAWLQGMDLSHPSSAESADTP